MKWQKRAVPLTKNLSFLGSRNLAPSYFSLQITASMRILMNDENTCHRLQRDRAPNKFLPKSITAVNTIRAAKLCSTLFVHGALLRSDASVVRKTMAKCNDSTVSCWMRMMSGIYPVSSTLYRIKKLMSPNCTFCDRGDKKIISLPQSLP